MKKKIIIGSIVVVLILAAAFLLWKFVFSPSATGSDSDTKITVSSVANIIGIGSGISSQTKFSGLVEPQETLNVEKDVDKKVSTLYVAAGDTVKAGAKLFKYDTDDIALKLEQTKLEIETISNKIKTINNQISDLKDERDKASESEQLSYTLQIQSLELDVKTEEYNKTTKANDAAKIEKSLDNTVVKSKIDGIIKSINSTDETINGEKPPYIAILSTGNYKLKSTISELNIDAVSPGQSVIVKSRVDENKTWSGKIDTIDRENVINGNNSQGNSYIMGGNGNSDQQPSASKYHFYVSLDNYDGLMLGQHVFIELDFGQSTKKEGIWLPSYYIVTKDGKSFVWIKNSNDKLEKKQITLGEQDTNQDTFQITDGLKISDYLAFPQENLADGMTTVVGDAIVNGMSDGKGGDITPSGDVAIPEGDVAIPEGDGAVASSAEPKPNSKTDTTDAQAAA